MSRITIPGHLVESFRSQTTPVELCDECGNLVGQFVPPVKVYEYGEVPYLSPEEIERRMKTGKEYSTEQVVDYLRSLPCSN